MMKKEIVLLFFPSTGPQVLEPPFGLVSLATQLKEAGIESRIIDCRIESVPEVLKSVTKDYTILFAGLSIMTGPQITFALRLAKYLRKKGIGPLVWGGVHVSLLPEETLKHGLVDYVLKGYADLSIVQFCKALKGEVPLEEVEGLGFKREGRIILHPVNPNPRLDELSLPDWSLINLAPYTHTDSVFLRKKSVFLFTSRGCPFSCSFCYGSSLHEKKWQGRSYEQITQELESLEKLTDFESVFFHDDNFSVDKERLRKVAHYLKVKKKSFVVSANLSTVSEEFVALLSECGCLRLDMAIESGSEKIRGKYQKHFSNAQIRKVFDWSNQYKLPMLTSFIVGHPDETASDTEETMALIDLIKSKYPLIEVIDIKVLTVYPKTLLASEVAHLGFSFPRELSKWGHFFWNTTNGPWQRKWHHDLSLVSLFAFRIHHFPPSNFFIHGLYRLLHHISLWRWRNRFFAIPIELRALHLVLKLWGRVRIGF